MQPSTKQFLADVFDSRTLSIEDVKPHLVDGRMLNMQSLFSDPVVRVALVFRRVWHAILRTYPSYDTTARFVATVSTASKHVEWGSELLRGIVAFAQEASPIFGIVVSRMHPEGQVDKSFGEAVTYLSDPVHVKRALVDKFALRFGRTLPPTEAEHSQNLLVTYDSYWQDSIKVLAEITGPARPDIKIDSVVDYYEYSDVVADLINLNHRLGVDAFTGFQSDAFSIRVQGNAMMTLFDAGSHAASLNGALMLLLMGSHCVYAHEDASVTADAYLISNVRAALEATNEREPSGKIVLLASRHVSQAVLKAISGFCVHTLDIIHSCMVSFLPKIATSFTAVNVTPSINIMCSLAPRERTISFGTNPSIYVPVARTVIAMSGTFGRDLSKFAIQRKYNEAPYELVYHDFIVEYCKNNFERMTTVRPTSKARNAVVIVDNRPNFLNVVAIKSCLINLKPNEWDVVVFCRDEDADYYRSRLGQEATYVTDTNLPPSKRFDMAFYNELLKSPSFWAKLLDYNRVLMAQDDGFLLKPGMEAEFLEYDYVGAPWNKNASYNKFMVAWGLDPNYVGNGGLSLRNPAAMLEICSKHTVARKALHYDGLQAEPEDVFFAKMCLKKGLNVPTYELAQRFASEEIIGDSYGFHKVFGYFPPHEAKAYFDRYIGESL